MYLRRGRSMDTTPKLVPKMKMVPSMWTYLVHTYIHTFTDNIHAIMSYILPYKHLCKTKIKLVLSAGKDMETRATSEEENVHPTLRDLNISVSDTRPTGESSQVL